MSVLSIVCVLLTGALLMFVYLQVANKLKDYELEKDYQELMKENRYNSERLKSTLKELEDLKKQSSKTAILEEGKEITYEAKKNKLSLGNKDAIKALLDEMNKA